MHVARCVIISPFFLFSLSQSGTIFPPLSPSIVTLVYLFIFYNAHMVAHHTIFFSSIFHHHSSVPSPLPSVLLSSLVSLSLSVMAYQDGFYGAADLYVSIPLSSTASLLTYIFFLLPVWFSSVKQFGPNPETCTFGCFNFLQRDTLCFPYQIMNYVIFAYT